VRNRCVFMLSRGLLLSLLPFVLAHSALAQFSCSAQSPNLTLRAEGVRELVGNLSMTCTNISGTATPASSATIQAAANQLITSKVLGTFYTEALVLNTAGDPLVNPGSAGNPIIQAVQGVASGTTVVFSSVTMPALAAGASTFFTISNIRVNATVAGDPQVTEAVLIQLASPNGTANFATFPSTVGFILPSFGPRPTTAPPSGAPPSTAFQVNFRELFVFAFKIAGTGNTTTTFGNTETGFTPGGAGFADWPNTPGASNIAKGTRILVTFDNIPPSLNVYVPVTVNSIFGQYHADVNVLTNWPVRPRDPTDRRWRRWPRPDRIGSNNSYGSLRGNYRCIRACD